MLDHSRILQDVQQFHALHPKGVIVIRGPTAVGKTQLSLEISQSITSQIISADSRQVYRGMNIGTDKVSQQMRNITPHHQIDIIHPDEHYTAAQRQKDSYVIIDTIHKQGELPIVVGGTGLYIDTIYRNYNLPEIPADPDYRQSLERAESDQPGILWSMLQAQDPIEAHRHHPASTRFIIRALEIMHSTGLPKSQIMKSLPVRYPLLMLGLWNEGPSVSDAIHGRIESMIHQGLEGEVRGLLSLYDASLKSMQTIDYKQTIDFIVGKYNYLTRKEQLSIAHHQLAKKQRTRFRKYIHEAKHSPKDDVMYRIYDMSQNISSRLI